MKKIIGFISLFLLFAGAIVAQEPKKELPAILKSNRKGKVVFDKDQAVREVNRARLAHSDAVWAKWGDKPCPPFAYKDMEGHLWTNETIKGKVTLINFWHFWCGPCIREMPWLNKLPEKYPDANFLSCTFNEASQIKKLVEKTPFLYHHLTDALALWKAFGIEISPTTIILDKEGRVFAVITGTNDTLKRAVESKLKEVYKLK